MHLLIAKLWHRHSGDEPDTWHYSLTERQAEYVNQRSENPLWVSAWFAANGPEIEEGDRFSIEVYPLEPASDASLPWIPTQPEGAK